MSPGRSLAAAFGVACIAATALAAGPAAPRAAAQLDQTCALALTAVDPTVVNTAYPDDSAKYYVGVVSPTPGTRVRISGRFPHARYMSFNVYDAALRPVGSLTDVDIAPAPGSVNPFAEGAPRTAQQRSYTAFIAAGDAPEQRAPNTMYAPPGQALTFIYRIYLPDRGRDDYGGTGLPTVTIEPAAGAVAPAQPSACADVVKPGLEGVNEALAQLTLPVGPPPGPGAKNPPRWRKFVNLASAIAGNVTGEPNPWGVNLDELGGSGGFASNRDNAYVSAGIDRGLGRVVVTQMRVPTFPDTRGGAPVMGGGQLRYWSLCQNDATSQRFIACFNDDRTVVRDGIATFVVSPPGDRPVNATGECGVNWLPWGPMSRGVLLWRNMLPAPGFAQSVQRARADHEAETMGDYLPRSRYVTQAEFEALGCRAASAQAVDASTRACLSRRLVVVTLPRGWRRLRAVTVRIGGARTLRVRVRRGGRVVVDLRGLPKGRYAVRVSRARGGTVARAYRTCSAGTRRG